MIKKKMKFLMSATLASCILGSICASSVATYARAPMNEEVTDISKDKEQGIGSADIIKKKQHSDKDSKAAIKEKQSNINNLIYGLNYDPARLLSFQGDSITSLPLTEADWRNGSFYVIKKQKKSMKTGNADISYLSSNEGMLYPGAVLLANRNLAEGKLTSIPAPKKDVKLTIDLPGLNGKENQKLVSKPDVGNVRGAINEMIDGWVEKSNYKQVPAKVEYDQTTAYSMSQLEAKFGLGVEAAAQKLNIDFSAINKGEKQCIVLRFKQIYYTVDAEAKGAPAQYFGDNVTAADLKRQGINDTNPPVYVSNVSYGRTIYAAVETNSNSDKFKSAVDAVIKGKKVSSSVELENIVKNSTFSAVVYGGGSNSGVKVVNGTLDSIKEIIDEGKTFSKDTPAVPVSFSTNFLKDNSPAVVKNATDYIETSTTEHHQGKLKLRHTGGYVAQFYVSWDEVSYKNGKKETKRVGWDGNGSGKTAGFSTEITLPANAENIAVKVIECTGLFWDWWHTVCDLKGMANVGSRTVHVWGTTLAPYHSSDPKAEND